MATTGELRAIIEELDLVDVGDAASFLGEEASVVEGLYGSDQASTMLSDVEVYSISYYRQSSCQGR